MVKNIIFILLLISSISAYSHDLAEIREVLKHVETNYDSTKKGDDGKSWGILQIQKSVILDVNNRYGTSYTHEDAFDIECAEEIFDLYIKMWSEKIPDRHGRDVTEEDIVRIWNGGPRGYQKKATLKYLKKYYKYKAIFNMKKRKCLVNGKLGMITEVYTHTYDILIFEGRRQLNGVLKKKVKILPKKEKIITNQIKLKF